jgi:hypothetical protein
MGSLYWVKCSSVLGRLFCRRERRGGGGGGSGGQEVSDLAVVVEIDSKR